MLVIHTFKGMVFYRTVSGVQMLKVQRYIFTKEKNYSDFLFVSLDDSVLSKEAYSQKTEFAPRETNSFLQELTPTQKEGNMKISCFP